MTKNLNKIIRNENLLLNKFVGFLMIDIDPSQTT